MTDHDCSETVKRVHEFFANELSDDEVTMVSEHLEHCAHCEEEFDVQYALNQAIEKACFADVPTDITDKIMSRLLQSQSQSQSGN